MSNLRVLMFGWEYAPYYTGGLGVVTKSIVKNLTQQGVEVIFVLPKVPQMFQPEFAQIINASSIDISNTKTIKELNKLIKIYSSTPLLPYMSENDYFQLKDKYIIKKFGPKTSYSSDDLYGNDLLTEVEKYAYRAIKIAEKYKHNIIHSHDWMTAKAGIEAKNISSSPAIIHVHATEFERTGGNPNQSIYNIEREGMQKSDLVIAVSELTKNRIIQYYGIPSEKIKVVHNAIDTYEGSKKIGKHINDSDKVVLFLGRLTVQKGADYLLEAAAKVLKHKKRVKFVFVGHGDMIQHLISKSIALGIEQKVLFAGFLSHKEVDKVYQMADLYVMPSVSEPFGITALEAMQNGTPVIISKQSGVSEVVNNVLKVDFWDVDEMANQILALISYPPLAKMISKYAEDEIKKIAWDKQSSRIVSIYKSL